MFAIDPIFRMSAIAACFMGSALGSDDRSGASSPFAGRSVHGSGYLGALTETPHQPEDTPASDAAPAPVDASELAKKTQNPVASLISLPFQYNTYFGIGPDDETANVLNIQPVLPFKLSDNWNLITRTIAPIIYLPDRTFGLPELAEGGQGDSAFGLGDINSTFYFSPITTSKLTWGVGPSLTLPTATDSILGSGKWSAGPAGVVVYSHERWVVGGLARQLWSFAGPDGRSEFNHTLLQPFVNYNLDHGWALSSAPIITANWSADDSDRWTIPLGGGVSKTFTLGHQAMQAGLQAYYNVEKPDGGPDWSLRIVVSFLFPK